MGNDEDSTPRDVFRVKHPAHARAVRAVLALSLHMYNTSERLKNIAHKVAAMEKLVAPAIWNDVADEVQDNINQELAQLPEMRAAARGEGDAE